MGVFVGLNFRNQIKGKYGEPLVSELDQLVSSISAALKDVIASKQSDISSTVTNNLEHKLLTSGTTQVITGANVTETDFFTFNMPASTMRNNGDLVRMVAYGTTATNSNGKNIRGYFGGTVVVSTGAQAYNNDKWKLVLEVIRQDASTFKCIGQVYAALNLVEVQVGYEEVSVPASGPIILKVTGQNSNSTAADIVFEAAYVEKIKRD